MNGRPNTRIHLKSITPADCTAILDAYQALGLHVNHSAMNPEYMALSLREGLECDSVEYRPDGHSQNKLDFVAYRAGDGRTYLHVRARPLDRPDCAELSDRFDKEIRRLFP